MFFCLNQQKQENHFWIFIWIFLRSYLHEQDALRQQLGVKALQRKMRMDLDQQATSWGKWTTLCKLRFFWSYIIFNLKKMHQQMISTSTIPILSLLLVDCTARLCFAWLGNATGRKVVASGGGKVQTEDWCSRGLAVAEAMASLHPMVCWMGFCRDRASVLLHLWSRMQENIEACCLGHYCHGVINDILGCHCWTWLDPVLLHLQTTVNHFFQEDKRYFEWHPQIWSFLIVVLSSFLTSLGSLAIFGLICEFSHKNHKTSLGWCEHVWSSLSSQGTPWWKWNAGRNRSNCVRTSWWVQSRWLVDHRFNAWKTDLHWSFKDCFMTILDTSINL